MSWDGKNSVKRYVLLLFQLDELIGQGKGDGIEAEAIRDCYLRGYRSTTQRHKASWKPSPRKKDLDQKKRKGGKG